jgi:hypothetical protein
VTDISGSSSTGRSLASWFHTLAGRVDAAVQIRDALLRASGKVVRVIGNTDRVITVVDGVLPRRRSDR